MKKMREISIEGCPEIGRGAPGPAVTACRIIFETQQYC